MFKPTEKEGETIIAKGVKVQGDFSSPGNMRIEGQVKGTVTTEADLMISESAKVNANVTALNAVIAGEVKGNLMIHDKLELLRTAKVVGDISTKILTIAEGAAFTGKCSMTGVEAALKTEESTPLIGKKTNKTEVSQTTVVK